MKLYSKLSDCQVSVGELPAPVTFVGHEADIDDERAEYLLRFMPNMVSDEPWPDEHREATEYDPDAAPDSIGVVTDPSVPNDPGTVVVTAPNGQIVTDPERIGRARKNFNDEAERIDRENLQNEMGADTTTPPANSAG